MRLAAPAPGRLKPQPDFHAFYRLNRQEGPAEPRLQFPVPMGVAAQTRGASRNDNGKDTAQRIALSHRPVYLFGHQPRSSGIRTPNR